MEKAIAPEINLLAEEWVKALGVTLIAATSIPVRSMPGWNPGYKNILLNQTKSYLDVVATTGSWLTRWRTPEMRVSGRRSFHQCRTCVTSACAKRMLRDAKECLGDYRLKMKAWTENRPRFDKKGIEKWEEKNPKPVAPSLAVFPEHKPSPVYVHHFGTCLLEAPREKPVWIDNYEMVLEGKMLDQDYDLQPGGIGVGLGRMMDICKTVAAARGKTMTAAYEEGMVIKPGSSAEAALEIKLIGESRLTVVLMPMRI